MPGLARVGPDAEVVRYEPAGRHPLGRYPAFGRRRGRYNPIEITRGCVYGCTFCQTPFMFKARFRHRPADHVADHVAQMVASGRRDVRFLTPTALSYGSPDESVQLDAVESLLGSVREAVGSRARIFVGTFPSEVRPEHVTPEAMALIGRYCDNDNLVIGGQSGSEEMLARTNRDHGVKVIVDAVRIARAAGLLRSLVRVERVRSAGSTGSGRIGASAAPGDGRQGTVMQGEGSLAGIRVLDLASGPARFATKLLAEMGADVVKPAGWGPSGRPMADPTVAARGGLLEWTYDGGKRLVAVDPESPEGIARLQRLATAADLPIDDAEPGWLAEHGLDHAHLGVSNPALVSVSLTAFGHNGPRAGWRGSDLVAAALGGVCALTGPVDKPLNSWGRQNEHFGSFVAVISALAALQAVRAGGSGQHVDVSLHEVVTGSIENLFFPYFYADRLDDLPAIQARQGSLHWLRVYDVVPARSGTVMITPTPSPSPLIDWMVEEGFEEAIEFAGLDIEEILARRDDLMALIARFCLGHDAGYLFTEAQSRRIAFGEVQSVPQVVANPQFAHRGFLQPVAWDGPTVITPGRPAQLSATPSPTPQPPPLDPLPAALVLDEWVRSTGPTRPAGAAGSVGAAGSGGSAGVAPGSSPRPPSAKPLDGIRIADFTWVLAGPFCTRMLGDLGADVVKVQNVERATLVNRPDYPYYPVWNRSKRSALLDMKHPDALGVARRLIEASDVLVENYSAGVLARWGLGWETVHAWNPRLIYVTMSGPGHDGPWRNVLSYAPTVHALCGLTYLTNPADRRDIGCGFSLNDHAAGFVAAMEILGALEARRRTGEGQRIDLAQLEVGSWLITPAVLELTANGRVTEPDGNADPFGVVAPNDTYRTGDGGWMAVSATDDTMWRRLAGVLGGDDLASNPSYRTAEDRMARRRELDKLLVAWCSTRPGAAAMEQLQQAGVAAGVVQNAPDLLEDAQHLARGFWQGFADHPIYGPRPYDRYPAVWSGSDLTPYRRAPVFGEHNVEVYRDVCGLDEADVAAGIDCGLFR